jgi:hypothetical protein
LPANLIWGFETLLMIVAAVEESNRSGRLLLGAKLIAAPGEAKPVS